nr:MAG TPA: hypothetical protein [Caudoviricetes sp.]
MTMRPAVRHYTICAETVRDGAAKTTIMANVRI